MFLSRFWGNKEGRRISILRSAIASSSHLKIFQQLFSSTWWSLHYWKYGSALLSWAIEQLNKRAEFNADGMAKRNSLRMRNTSCQRVWSSNSSWKNGQYSLTWVKMGALNTSAMIWIIEAFKTTTTCRFNRIPVTYFQLKFLNWNDNGHDLIHIKTGQ